MRSSINAALSFARPARSARRSRRLALLATALWFVTALCLRLYRLGAQSLWLDEGGTWAEVTGRTGKGWGTLVTELWSKDAAYPLYHLLLKAWIAVAGDSEWALRFPSALAGAGAVAALYVASIEVARPKSQEPARGIAVRAYHRVTLLLAATSPFALWYAQDAKVYSLLMFVIALLVWALLRAVRRNDPRAWLLVVALAVISVFVHRLALLALAGTALAAALTFVRQNQEPGTKNQETRTRTPAHLRTRSAIFALAAALGGAGIYGVVLALRGTTAGASGHVAAGPLLGLWLTLTHFSVDRGNIAGWLGLPLLVWVLPCAALTLWGGALLCRAALRREPAAIVVLCMASVPLALLVIALAITPIYEARYATIAFPAWVLVLAWPLLDDQPSTTLVFGFRMGTPATAARTAGALVLGLLIINAAVLLQPQHGQFSGAPVKEQWRDAINDIAHRAHPDDLILIQPYYVQPLWDYYAPRVTPDRLPAPNIFPIFAEGDTCNIVNPTPTQLSECKRRRHEPYFNAFAKGKTRALLLIAPDHAATVDPPKTLAELLDDCHRGPCSQPPTKDDTYGFVGLRFQHAKEQQTWPCGGATFVGVATMCASFPAPFDVTQGARPQPPAPAIPLEATFGGELKLRGYSLDRFDGKAQPGGTLPITLYWVSVRNPSQTYTMFVHLCRDCERPPLASTDGPPLGGYDPAGDTRTWRGYPVHDERALQLPTSLAPGRYTLILGVYPPDQPAENQRLPVISNATALPHNRLVLGEVTISAPNAP